MPSVVAGVVDPFVVAGGVLPKAPVAWCWCRGLTADAKGWGLVVGRITSVSGLCCAGDVVVVVVVLGVAQAKSSGERVGLLVANCGSCIICLSLSASSLRVGRGVPIGFALPPLFE